MVIKSKGNQAETTNEKKKKDHNGFKNKSNRWLKKDWSVENVKIAEKKNPFEKWNLP